MPCTSARDRLSACAIIGTTCSGMKPKAACSVCSMGRAAPATPRCASMISLACSLLQEVSFRMHRPPDKSDRAALRLGVQRSIKRSRLTIEKTYRSRNILLLFNDVRIEPWGDPVRFGDQRGGQRGGRLAVWHDQADGRVGLGADDGNGANRVH